MLHVIFQQSSKHVWKCLSLPLCLLVELCWATSFLQQYVGLWQWPYSRFTARCNFYGMPHARPLPCCLFFLCNIPTRICVKTDMHGVPALPSSSKCIAGWHVCFRLHALQNLNNTCVSRCYILMSLAHNWYSAAILFFLKYLLIKRSGTSTNFGGILKYSCSAALDLWGLAQKVLFSG